jgi:GTPase
MPAEFYVGRCYEISGVGLVIAGNVSSGEIREGQIGQTFKGKKCTVVKIEKEGYQIPSAEEKDSVSLFVKYLSRQDLKPGDFLYFG